MLFSPVPLRVFRAVESFSSSFSAPTPGDAPTTRRDGRATEEKEDEPPGRYSCWSPQTR